MVALFKKSILQTARRCRRNKVCDFQHCSLESRYQTEQPKWEQQTAPNHQHCGDGSGVRACAYSSCLFRKKKKMAEGAQTHGDVLPPHRRYFPMRVSARHRAWGGKDQPANRAADTEPLLTSALCFAVVFLSGPAAFLLTHLLPWLLLPRWVPAEAGAARGPRAGCRLPAASSHGHGAPAAVSALSAHQCPAAQHPSWSWRG